MAAPVAEAGAPDLPARRLRAALALAALVLAFSGQAVLTGDAFTRGLDTEPLNVTRQQGLKAAALLFLAVAAAFASARVGVSPETAMGPEARSSSSGDPLEVARKCLPAIGLWAVSIAVFLIFKEGRLVRLLWAASMILTVWPFRRDLVLQKSSLPSWGRVALGAILLAGLAVRVLDLGDLPAHVDNDISWMALETQRLIQIRNYNWFGLAESDHYLAWHRILAYGMDLFGSDFRGILYPSAIAGALTIPFVYLLGRDLHSRNAGLASATLFAFSYTHIHFSRTMFGPKPGLLITASLALLVRGMQGGGLLSFGFGGLALGAAILTYDSGRIGPPLILAVAVLAWVVDRRTLRRQLGGLLLFAVGAMVSFGPMLGFAVKDFEGFVGRGDQVAVFSKVPLEHTMDKYHTRDMKEVLFQQVVRSFGTLHLYGDESPHFNLQRPMISALAAALLMLGVGVSLAGYRRAMLLLPLLWLVLTFLLGGVLTKDPPYWPHFNIAIPATALLGGIGGVSFVSALSSYAPLLGRLGGAALVVALAANAWHSWTLYQRFGSRNQDSRITLARYLGSLDPQTEVLVEAPDIPWNDFVFQHWYPARVGRNLSRERILEVPRDDSRARLFVVEKRELARELKRRHPVSWTRAHLDAWRDVLFWTVAVQPPRPSAAPPRQPARPGMILVLAGALGTLVWSCWTPMAHLGRAFAHEHGGG